MDDDVSLTEFDAHEANACGGTASACTYCDAEDILRAERIKAATPREFACRTCGRETGGPTRCLRCQDKYDQLEMERLYESRL